MTALLDYNRFPARVVTSDGTTLNRCAVVVIDGQARLAVQRPQPGMGEADAVQVIATLSGVKVTSGREALLEADDGQWWRVGDGDGCGCRSPLQAWYSEQVRGVPAGT